MSRRRRTRSMNVVQVICWAIVPATMLFLITVHLWFAGFDGTSFR